MNVFRQTLTWTNTHRRGRSRSPPKKRSYFRRNGRASERLSASSWRNTDDANELRGDEIPKRGVRDAGAELANAINSSHADHLRRFARTPPESENKGGAGL